MSGSHSDKEVLDLVLAFCSALETREVQLRSFCRHGVQVRLVAARLAAPRGWCAIPLVLVAFKKD